MKTIIEIITNNWISILKLVSAYLLGFVTVYFNQKTKNKALLSDIKKLTNEKEEVKKEHSLEVEKRKYQYESKKNEYFRYFNLIDSFSATNTKDFIEQFSPIITKFSNDLIISNENKELQAKAISEYNGEVQKLVFKANENLIKIKQETNTIKLIAGNQTLKILSEMEVLYEKSMAVAGDLMKSMNKLIIMNDKSDFQNLQNDLEEVGREIISNKESLIREIREELDVI